MAWPYSPQTAKYFVEISELRSFDHYIIIIWLNFDYYFKVVPNTAEDCL